MFGEALAAMRPKSTQTRRREYGDLINVCRPWQGCIFS
jgi:hypothetical protein